MIHVNDTIWITLWTLLRQKRFTKTTDRNKVYKFIVIAIEEKQNNKRYVVKTTMSNEYQNVFIVDEHDICMTQSEANQRCKDEINQFKKGDLIYVLNKYSWVHKDEDINKKQMAIVLRTTPTQVIYAYSDNLFTPNKMWAYKCNCLLIHTPNAENAKNE